MKKGSFVGYEYMEIPVKRSAVNVYADGYESFGWELEGTEEQPGKLAFDTITMKFKRDRKIRNKVDLLRVRNGLYVHYLPDWQCGGRPAG